MVRPGNALFIYDLDDTLFPNHHFFVDARRRFLEMILGTSQGERAKQLGTLRDEIDTKNIDRLGYSPERLGTSFRQAYHQWQAQHDFPIDDNLSQQLYDLGINVANRSRIISTGLYPGTIDVLKYHAQQSHEMLLLTKGHEPTQLMKFKALKLRGFFDYLRIKDGVKDKKDDVFAEYASDPRPKFTIGNSIKSDILPALQYGFQAIHMNTDTWDHEKAEKPAHVPSVDNMAELLAYLRTM